MDFGQHEESLLKSHSKHTDHRDWAVILWLIVSFPSVIYVSRLHPGESSVVLTISMMTNAATWISALLDKSIYIHFITLMVHAKPGVDLQKWVRLNTRASILMMSLFILNTILSCVYVCLIISK